MHQARASVRLSQIASFSPWSVESVLAHKEAWAEERTCAWAPPISPATDAAAPGAALANRCCRESLNAVTFRAESWMSLSPSSGVSRAY